jgi:hypothetical protein
MYMDAAWQSLSANVACFPARGWVTQGSVLGLQAKYDGPVVFQVWAQGYAMAFQLVLDTVNSWDQSESAAAATAAAVLGVSVWLGVWAHAALPVLCCAHGWLSNQ